MSDEREILVRTVGSGAWSTPATTSYVNEAHLRDLLVADPGRVPGVSSVAIAVPELGTSAGPADVCAVDMDGSITVVECKLASNSERRRMVIGQVLDYASAIWLDGPDAFRAAWAGSNGGALDEKLSTDAMAALESNISNARIHLCLAVDAIDAELRRLVEFLNRATAVEVHVTALQLAYAAHADVEILIPTTFGGELAEAKKRAASSASSPWTWDSFIGALASDSDRVLAQRYLERLHEPEERYGSHALLWFGARPGGGIFLHPYGLRYAPVQLWANTAGQLMLYGNWSVYTAIAAHPAFARLAQLLGQDHTKGYKGVRADTLDCETIWNEVLQVAVAINGHTEARRAPGSPHHPPRHLAEIFEPEPEQWGLRGDPYVWRRMRELLGDTLLPIDVNEGRRLVRDAFRTAVGVDVEHQSEDDRVFREDLDHGGMSGGNVDLVTWRERLVPELERRLRSIGQDAEL